MMLRSLRIARRGVRCFGKAQPTNVFELPPTAVPTFQKDWIKSEVAAMEDTEVMEFWNDINSSDEAVAPPTEMSESDASDYEEKMTEKRDAVLQHKFGLAERDAEAYHNRRVKSLKDKEKREERKIKEIFYDTTTHTVERDFYDDDDARSPYLQDEVIDRGSKVKRIMDAKGLWSYISGPVISRHVQRKIFLKHCEDPHKYNVAELSKITGISLKMIEIFLEDQFEEDVYEATFARKPDPSVSNLLEANRGVKAVDVGSLAAADIGYTPSKTLLQNLYNERLGTWGWQGSISKGLFRVLNDYQSIANKQKIKAPVMLRSDPKEGPGSGRRLASFERMPIRHKVRITDISEVNDKEAVLSVQVRDTNGSLRWANMEEFVEVQRREKTPEFKNSSAGYNRNMNRKRLA